MTRLLFGHCSTGGWARWATPSTSRQITLRALRRFRLTVLARVPAPVRFASVEPFLAPVDLTAWLSSGSLSWVIVGGESGQRARSIDLRWLDSLKSQCEE